MDPAVAPILDQIQMLFTMAVEQGGATPEEAADEIRRLIPVPIR
jgi:hypothetical protein